MIFKSFRDYIFRELIFPKTLVVDRPGVIINKRISKFSKNFNMTRVVYVFEQFAVDLYTEAVKSIGKENADFLWYKISKNSAVRYMLFYGNIKIPDFLISSFLEYVFSSLAHTGISFAEELDVDLKNKSIVARGKNCFICRKNGAGCIPAGVLSAVWSHLNGENIEAEARCGECPAECMIVSNKKIPKKYDIDYEMLRPMKNYKIVNFKQDAIERSYKMVSFSDFVRFGKIDCDEEKKVFNFKGEGIAHIEVGLLELIYQEYERLGHKELFRELLLKSSGDLMKRICSGGIDRCLREMESLLCAFGWGSPIRFQKGNEIKYKFLHPPISKYSPVFRATVLNGFLNSIFEKEFEIKDISSSEIIFEVS